MATVKFIQAQKFSLAGSGASIGDTTLLLQSFAGINGTLLTTTDLGVRAFGTIEPGNGSQEEQISFTGVTQNSNGTATLTGVSTVLFVSPYTATSGIGKTHAGASTFILSNDAGFYGQILDYIDTAIVSGGVPATTTVLGLNKISVAPVSPASPIAVGDNDPRIPTAGQAQALVGTAGTPSSTNQYVTASGLAGFPPIFRSYTVSSSWVKPSNLKYIIVKVQGGGGGGGLGTTTAFGGPGGGGAYGEKTILAATLGTSEIVTIGGGGLGRTSTAGDGSPGSGTSLGSQVTAGGGAQGLQNGNPGNGGTATSADWSTAGQTGPTNGTATKQSTYGGGSSKMGFGKGGASGQAFGSGGDGNAANTSDAFNGSAGIVLITEYYI